jgi:hypothetical protein
MKALTDKEKKAVKLILSARQVQRATEFKIAQEKNSSS